jgi:putative two-component system response regulator
MELIKAGSYADELLSWDLEIALSSSRLHDVGKTTISDVILNKPSKLTGKEFELMKTHTKRGVDIVSCMANHGHFPRFMEHAGAFAGTHHEKWDGSGYPYGLNGHDIPLEGRLLAVADVYDALTSARPYKSAYSARESARFIIEGAGTHFDPVVVDAFRLLTGEFTAISRRYGDSLPKQVPVKSIPA